MKYQTLNPNIFVENRKRFAAAMKPNSVAIFHSNDIQPRNGDCGFPFRQNSDFFWLTGIDQEESVLILYPDSPKGKDLAEILFLKETNEHIAVWEGHKYTKEEGTQTSGIQQVRWLDTLEAGVRENILLADHVYLNSNENDRANIEVPTRDERFAKVLQEKYPAHKFERSQQILKNLRMVKTAGEVDVIRIACSITEKALRRVLTSVRPGQMEYEVEAEVIHEFIRNGATGHAYTPIIAGGGNACVLHYIDNNMPLRDGDLLLMDFGCEYANYASDLTRTIPVNGKFSPRQRDVYNAVLRVMKAATKMLVPGTVLDDYHKAVGELMQEELVGLGLISREDIQNQNPAWPAYKKYFMHGTSHHLGLDVHDLCVRSAPFAEGMVFTCEPGIYIPEEGIGIRIENDILITADGPVDLMASIPIEVDEIEALMAR